MYELTSRALNVLLQLRFDMTESYIGVQRSRWNAGDTFVLT